jgi:hypothetical protein
LNFVWSGSRQRPLPRPASQPSTITRPDDGSAALSDPNAEQPSFIADRPGLYVVQLIVNDGFHNSAPGNAAIQAQAIVPNPLGLTQGAAEAAILVADLVVGTVAEQSSDTVPTGDVISQDPVAGANVAASSAVDLVVSLGPVLTTVPDVVGQSQAAAQTAITGAGLVVGSITTANSDIVQAGNVISQNPAGGTDVSEGSAVDLVISSGSVPGPGDILAPCAFRRIWTTSSLAPLRLRPWISS